MGPDEAKAWGLIDEILTTRDKPDDAAAEGK